MGHFIPKGTLVVMTSNLAYEDADHAAHQLGPMTGEPPGPQSPLPTNSEEGVHYESDGDGVKGKWAAGTGKLFDPERWLKDGVFDPNSGPSLPFSLGQRGCFGKSLAVSLCLVYGGGLWADG